MKREGGRERKMGEGNSILHFRTKKGGQCTALFASPRAADLLPSVVTTFDFKVMHACTVGSEGAQ